MSRSVAYAPTMMALTRLALKHSSSSQKSRGGSMHLASEDLDRGEPRGRGLLPPERGVVAGGRRIGERTNPDLSVQHRAAGEGVGTPKDSERSSRGHPAGCAAARARLFAICMLAGGALARPRAKPEN